MAINIPQSLFDTFNETIDYFIDDSFGVDCRLYFAKNRVDCTNCINTNSNIYGGFDSFVNRNCHYCGGLGYKESEQTEDIKLRLYYDKKKWLRIIDPIDAPDGTVQVIGYLSDLPSLRAADYMVINTAQEDIIRQKYKTFGEFNTHGFKHDRYIVGYLQRVA